MLPSHSSDYGLVLKSIYFYCFTGCYEVSIDDSNVRSLIKNITVPDLRECALSCSSRIEDIGWVVCLILSF